MKSRNTTISPDDNPLVRELLGYLGEYTLAGYTGHGMLIAFGVGKAIVQVMAGQESKLPDSGSPERVGELQWPSQNFNPQFPLDKDLVEVPF